MHRIFVMSCLLIGVPALTAGAQGAPSIRGTVRDEGSTVLEQVEIVVLQAGKSATTDGRGQYRIDGLKRGRYSLVARRPGFWPSRVFVEVRDDVTATMDFTMIAAPQVLEEVVVRGDRRGLYGVVGDSTFQPKPGTRIQVRGSVRAEAATDSAGRFAFPDLKGGGYTITATLPGHATRQMLVTIPEKGSKEVVVMLRPEGTRLLRGLEWALRDLGTRLAQSPQLYPTYLTREELARYPGKQVCDIPRFRFAVKTDLAILVVNGLQVLRSWPLCDLITDEFDLVEWGFKCSDASGGMVVLLGRDCDGPRDVGRGRRQAYGTWVAVWTRGGVGY